MAQAVRQPVYIDQAGDALSPHLVLLTITGEVVFVIILAVISGAGPMAESIVMTILVGLWLGFIIHSGAPLIANLKMRN